MTAYDLPNLMPGGSAFGGPAYGQLGLLAPAQQGYNPLTARQPSIVDRVLGRLFPAGQYAGLLDPTAQRGLQRQGLLSLGSSLLQAGGPQAYQGGTLANIGGALQQSQMNFPLMAHQALQIQAYKGQQQEQQAIADVAKEYPITPGMSREDMYTRASAILQRLLTIPGAARLAEQMAPAVAAMKPATPDRARWSFQTVMEGGEPVLYRVNEDTGVKYRVGVGKPTAEQRITPKQTEHAEFGAGALAAWKTVEGIRQKNPGVEQEVGKIMTSPAFVSAIPGFRHSSDAVLALQKAGASQDAQNYMRAKWPFLDNIIRTRIPGGRMNGQYMTQVAQEFMPSLDTEANAQMRNNEIQAILTAQGESGYDESPTVWNNAVKRHGVGGLDLQAILQGGGMDRRLNSLQNRYPPR
jgi:hypothetical protein